jgi:uncharacterized protein YkwD
MGVLLAFALCLASACAADDVVVRDEARVLALVNGARADLRLPPLERDEALDQFASVNTRKMLRAGRPSHSDAARFKSLGLKAWAENVGNGPNVEKLHERMLQSPRHRDNMLGPYTRVGVSIALAPDGQRFVTVVFGTPR